MYLALKTIHVLAAIVSVGAMPAIAALHWAAHRQAPDARAWPVQALERLVSYGGLVLVASGLGMAAATGWQVLRAPWLIASLGLLVATLACNVWLERAAPAPTCRVFLAGSPVAWPLAKSGLFLLMAALMTFKPA